MIDVLYVSFNRLPLTRESFQALVDNTAWDKVATLYIADDGSTDGSREWLEDAAEDLDGTVAVRFSDGRFGGPVAAMNWYLDNHDPDVDRFAKVDNDFVVCPGWLPELARQLVLHPDLQIVGTEPMVGSPTAAPLEARGIQPARHIGGKGLIRVSAFQHCRPRPSGFNGYQGFTQWQHKHPEITKAWITPDLPCFGLDQLPFEPWLSLAVEHAEVGWARRWAPYDETATGYWGWWEPAHMGSET